MELKSKKKEVVPQRRKKLYRTPRLIEHGSVSALTAGMNGSKFDPGHSTRTKLGGP